RVSRCIMDERDCSFSQLVTRCRFDHAQRMMREQPDSKLSAVALASGFANETSFFRVFKSVTGLTPKEWLNINS
ncbi:MAG: AraC family transcriptional regulator, partial [Muribaculaceae bacterium]|nr:AraC family transcriptional regulator [Muribaculaceae bacterium]